MSGSRTSNLTQCEDIYMFPIGCNTGAVQQMLQLNCVQSGMNEFSFVLPIPSLFPPIPPVLRCDIKEFNISPDETMTSCKDVKKPHCPLKAV